MPPAHTERGRTLLITLVEGRNTVLRCVALLRWRRRQQARLPLPVPCSGRERCSGASHRPGHVWSFGRSVPVQARGCAGLRSLDGRSPFCVVFKQSKAGLVCWQQGPWAAARVSPLSGTDAGPPVPFASFLHA